MATEDKIVFGSWWDGPLIVVTDLLLHWPAYDTAHIGLLLVDGRRQNEGLGRRTLTALDVHTKMWHWLRRWRIAVVRSNAQALGFWERMGYTPTRAVQALPPWATRVRVGHPHPSCVDAQAVALADRRPIAALCTGALTFRRASAQQRGCRRRGRVFLTRRARRLPPGLWLLCEDARRW